MQKYSVSDVEYACKQIADLYYSENERFYELARELKKNIIISGSANEANKQEFYNVLGVRFDYI